MAGTTIPFTAFPRIFPRDYITYSKSRVADPEQVFKKLGSRFGQYGGSISLLNMSSSIYNIGKKRRKKIAAVILSFV